MVTFVLLPQCCLCDATYYLLIKVLALRIRDYLCCLLLLLLWYSCWLLFRVVEVEVDDVQ
jgi:hypothetical protein